MEKWLIYKSTTLSSNKYVSIIEGKTLYKKNLYEDLFKVHFSYHYISTNKHFPFKLISHRRLNICKARVYWILLTVINNVRFYS